VGSTLGTPISAEDRRLDPTLQVNRSRDWFRPYVGKGWQNRYGKDYPTWPLIIDKDA